LSGRTYSQTVVWFAKTPPTILCPHFYELRWAFGCNYSCAWCYLLGTGWGRKHFRDYSLRDVLKHIHKALQEITQPSLFNTGELSDSYPNHPNMIAIMNLFETQRTHKVLLLTKTADAGRLAQDASKRKQTIYSCSLNALPVAEKWELKTPSPLERIKALKKAVEAGIQVRVRIDPVVPIEGWRQHYGELVDMINGIPQVKRVTIGTLRGLPRTIMYGKKLGCDMSWTKYFDVKTGWGLKMSDELRRGVYGFMFDRLQAKEKAICKETREMAKEFKLDLKMKCSCVL